MRFLSFYLVLISNSALGQVSADTISHWEFIAVHGTVDGKFLKWLDKELDTIPNRLDSIFKRDHGYWFVSYDSAQKIIAEGDFHIHHPKAYFNNSLAETFLKEWPDSILLCSSFFYMLNSVGKYEYHGYKTCHYSLSIPCDDCPVLDNFSTGENFTGEEIRRFTRH